MSELSIWQNGQCRVIAFEGQPVLRDVLSEAGYLIPHPCGGRGSCGKCRVTLEGAVSAPNSAELHAGHRLSCQAKLLGDAAVFLSSTCNTEQIETRVGSIGTVLHPMEGRYGAAVDIGTTTIAVKVCDLETGVCIGEAACRNSQTAVAADVMGRIEAACRGNGAYLRKLVLQDIHALLHDATKNTVPSESIDSLVLTGNTTMLYLLSGFSPEALSHAPFHADHLFDTEARILDRQTYLPPCMSAFVGADITCAVWASGMCQSSETALLCDIGTNGEIALWKDGKLFVTSTAAGPAFEGAGISCGCGCTQGAIDQVWLEESNLCLHTIGEGQPTGLCGSGLVDAIAAGLQCEIIDETGALEGDAFTLCDTVRLLPRDIRAVQLAKAAIAAGIATLTQVAEVSLEEIETLYIAGGFGSHLNVDSAAHIGLIPKELKSRVKILGNASLTGAMGVLLNTRQCQALRRIAFSACHVDLGGNPRFNENYVAHMLFDSDDAF